MKIFKCPICQAALPIKWVLLSGVSKTYTCVSCKNKLRLNAHRNSIVLCISIMLYIYLLNHFKFLHMNNAVLDFFINAAAFITIFTVLLIIFPKSYCLAIKENKD